MSIRNLLLTIILVIFSTNSISAQKLDFDIELGYQSYYMYELSRINTYTLSKLPFDAKIINNYPSQFNYSSDIIYSFNNYLGVGIKYTFLSTGSRISRADYSGEYLFDNKIRGHSPGVLIKYNFMELNKFNFSLISEVGIIFNKLFLSESLVVNDTYLSKNEYNFKSSNFYGDLGFKIQYPVFNFKIGLQIGYQYDFRQNELTLIGNHNIKMTNEYNEATHANWSGINYAISISLFM